MRAAPPCSYVILAALVLSACASKPPARLAQTQPTDPAIIERAKARQDTATKVYVMCLFRAAKTLDDGKSDPATIAQAMLSACAAEFNDQVMAYLSGDMDLEVLERRMREDALGPAIQIVLKNRKAAQSH